MQVLQRDFEEWIVGVAQDADAGELRKQFLQQLPSLGLAAFRPPKVRLCCLQAVMASRERHRSRFDAGRSTRRVMAIDAESRSGIVRKGGTMTASLCRVLMVYPSFHAESFWNYAEVCNLVGARYPAAPLGLITVAALLPKTWEVRLVDRNAGDLTEEDLCWADVIMTGGMLNQQADTLEVIKLGQRHGKPVVVGGPDVTSSPHIYSSADFRVLGEAEGIIDEFVTAWDSGVKSGMFAAEKFQVDVTKSPIPRFDLLKFDQYLYIGVQYSRGCPLTCEFCDIIELYGRVPRAKTTPQMLAELERLHQLGYRGHVDFVDDNLIGNKKVLKAFLPPLITWLELHDSTSWRIISEFSNEYSTLWPMPGALTVSPRTSTDRVDPATCPRATFGADLPRS